MDELTREHGDEVNRTPDLPEAMDRLATSMDGLSRTMTAWMEQLEAEQDGGALAPVAVVQKQVVDGAAKEAASVTERNGAVRRVLQVILGKLKRASEWLWSMIIQLATIQQWSLGGKIKVPGLAEANITMTFGAGPPDATASGGA
jgi:hypothetical protein